MKRWSLYGDGEEVSVVHVGGRHWLNRSRGGGAVHGWRDEGGEEEVDAVHCCGGGDRR
jgi:hypothetical protein